MNNLLMGLIQTTGFSKPVIFNGGLNYSDNIENAYVKNGQLTVVAMREGYSSAMLSSVCVQQFSFGKFAAKIRLPFLKEIWPAW